MYLNKRFNEVMFNMSNDHINCCDGCRGRYCASKVPIFENLEENELSKIVQSIDHRQYLKGELLFDEGSTANNMFFINEGKIKLYKYTKEGKEQILHILSEGEFFGELNLVKSSIHNFNAKAIKNSKICVLSNEEMNKIIIKNPQIGIKLLQSVGERLSDIENLAQNLATNDADSRVAYLLIDMLEKTGRVNGDVKEINIQMSREDMANCVGVTRETLSRKLRSFEEEGLIKIPKIKQILILDEETLRSYI